MPPAGCGGGGSLSGLSPLPSDFPQNLVCRRSDVGEVGDPVRSPLSCLAGSGREKEGEDGTFEPPDGGLVFHR